MPSSEDRDGNLLADSWEELFFGKPGNDAFADFDGDGYSNLQEMFAGTAPDDALVTPGGQPHSLQRPIVQLVPNGSQWRLIFQWPDALSSQVRFGIQQSDDVTGPFSDAPVSLPLISLGGNFQELCIDNQLDARKFLPPDVPTELTAGAALWGRQQVQLWPHRRITAIAAPRLLSCLSVQPSGPEHPHARVCQHVATMP